MVLEPLVRCFGFKLVAHSRARSDLQEHRLCLARSVDVLEHLQRILRLVAASRSAFGAPLLRRCTTPTPRPPPYPFLQMR